MNLRFTLEDARRLTAIGLMAAAAALLVALAHKHDDPWIGAVAILFFIAALFEGKLNG